MSHRRVAPHRVRCRSPQDGGKSPARSREPCPSPGERKSLPALTSTASAPHLRTRRPVCRPRERKRPRAHVAGAENFRARGNGPRRSLVRLHRSRACKRISQAASSRHTNAARTPGSARERASFTPGRAGTAAQETRTAESPPRRDAACAASSAGSPPFPRPVPGATPSDAPPPPWRRPAEHETWIPRKTRVRTARRTGRPQVPRCSTLPPNAHARARADAHRPPIMSGTIQVPSCPRTRYFGAGADDAAKARIHGEREAPAVQHPAKTAAHVQLFGKKHTARIGRPPEYGRALAVPRKNPPANRRT